MLWLSFRVFVVCGLLWGALGAAAMAAERPFWVADFEHGTVAEQFSFSGNDTTHIAGVADGAPVRFGKGAARFTLTRDTDRVNYRTEIVPRDSGFELLEWGKEYWIGFSFWLQDWGVDEKSMETVFQIHKRPHTDATGAVNWNCVAARNPISLTTNGPNLQLHVVTSPRLTEKASGGAVATLVWSEPFRANTWYDWVMRLRISPGEDGIIQVWRNGELIYEQFGGNSDLLDTCGLPSTPADYFKFGVYKWDWQRFASDVPRRELYCDEIRMGNVDAGYRGGYLGVTPPDVRFHFTLPGLAGELTGPTAIAPQLQVRDGYALAELRLEVDGTEIYRGGDVPAQLLINRGELSDGPHTLTAIAVDSENHIHAARYNFSVQNTRVEARPPGPQTGAFAPIRIETALPESEIAQVAVDLGDKPVYAGAAVPADLAVDTRPWPDGIYPVQVRIITRQGAVSTARQSLPVNLRWEMVDQLEGVTETSWFGVLDRSKTAARSAGWAFDSAAAEAFFNDPDRMSRAHGAEEYLIWDAPRLVRAMVTMYGRRPEVIASVRLSYTTDGVRWEPLPFQVAETGVSPAGWHRLELSAALPENADVKQFRLTLVETGQPPSELQLGSVRLEGWESWL